MVNIINIELISVVSLAEHHFQHIQCKQIVIDLEHKVVFKICLKNVKFDMFQI